MIRGFNISTMGIVLGVSLLVGSALRAYNNFPASNETDLSSWLRFIHISLQSVTGAALIFYFALGTLKPIAFGKAATPGWDASHMRPSFQNFGKNPVLAKFGRVSVRPPTK